MQIQQIQKLSPSELQQIVELHYQVLDQSVLNKFGKTFLTLIYPAIAENNNNIFLLAKQDDQILGFLVATLNVSNFYQGIIKDKFFPLSFEVLKSFIKYPKTVLEVIFWLLFPQSKQNHAELQFIAVSPQNQSRGLGTRLIELLNNTFEKKVIEKYVVGTKAYNIRSNNFYKKLGFKFLNSKKILGDNFNYYQKALHVPADFS